jgi:hypothetical protein
MFIDYNLNPSLGGKQENKKEFYFVCVDSSQKENVVKQFHKIKQVEEIWSLDGVYNLIIKTQIDLHNKKMDIFCPALKSMKGIREVLTGVVIKFISCN